jgi:hypothetical protein
MTCVPNAAYECLTNVKILIFQLSGRFDLMLLSILEINIPIIGGVKFRATPVTAFEQRHTHTHIFLHPLI